MLNETAAHTACLAKLLRPGLALTFPRHWAGKVPYLDDDDDIYAPIPSPLQGRNEPNVPSPLQGRGRLSTAERGEGADIPLPLDGGGRHTNSPLPFDGEGRDKDSPLPLDGGGRDKDSPLPSMGRGGGGVTSETRQIHPCAFCALPIAPETLVRLRVQKPTGPVKRPEFDEQSLPVHFDCLAKVSTMKFG